VCMASFIEHNGVLCVFEQNVFKIHFLFSLPNGMDISLCSCIHQLVNIWVLSTFWLL